MVALLGGTAAAFAVTQGLKLEPSPVRRPTATKLFAPLCRCATSTAKIAFDLRSSDVVTVRILVGDDVVRTLVAARRFGAGPVELVWNGRDDTGAVVADGDYRLRVQLAEARRTIALPHRIQADVTAPKVSVAAVSRRVFSPDGDGRADAITLRYRLSEPGRASLLVDGRRRTRGRTRSRRQGLAGPLHWFGRRGGEGLPAKTYRIAVTGEDRAGNRSPPTRPIRVRIRYIELPRDVLHVRAGARFVARVSTDARPYRWQLGARRGLAGGPRLVLRAPRRGRYLLKVQANGRSDQARVIVGRRP